MVKDLLSSRGVVGKKVDTIQCIHIHVFKAVYTEMVVYILLQIYEWKENYYRQYEQCCVC